MEKSYKRFFNFSVFTSHCKQRIEIVSAGVIAYDLKSARKKVKKNWARRTKNNLIPKNPKFKRRLDQ